MPKVVVSALPLSGLFAVSKPSGPTSMSVLEDIKRLINKSRLFVDAQKLENRSGSNGGRKKRNEGVKIGQGGTLDPLADGVLGAIRIIFPIETLVTNPVVGVGKGTKRLTDFLDCVKVPRSLRLHGAAFTPSYVGV